MTDVYLFRLKKNREYLLRDLEPRQVLNYLYQEDVIDADDRDDVKSERTRKRQAEALLDMLERRGPNAVHYLVKGLQKSPQKYLADVLNKPLANEDTVKTVISPAVGVERYPMDKIPCGFAVVINNAKFEDGSLLEARPGSEGDVRKMRYLFEWLNFIVKTHENMTAQEMILEIRRIAKEEDHTDYNCLVLFLMSHGSNSGIFGTDGRDVKYDDITSYFSAKNCESLAGKPKLIFIQACRGSKPDKGHDVLESPRPQDAQPAQESNTSSSTTSNTSSSTTSSNLPSEHDSLESGLKYPRLPNDADIFVGFASSPKLAALRNTLRGGWFVDRLNDVMKMHAGQEDLMSMMTMVTGKVADMESGNYIYKQCPQQCTNLRKKLFFKPKTLT